ncbi:MAG TPA: malonyl-ACP O-methyltransferase BioC [Cellvibrio sp.]|nr:malonyl-ACP O-methyltransferase BioC [Cellvibrio sp.]
MINMVLLHGWGCDSRTWHPILPSLEKIGRVTVLDLPGFGSSPAVDPFSLDTVLNSLAAQLPDQAVIVGWSLGAMLGVQLAARFPEKIRALVSLAANAKFVASTDYPTAMPDAVNHEFNLSFVQDAQATVKLFYGLMAQGDNAERQLLKNLRKLIPEVIPAHWLQLLELLRELDNREALAGLTQPVLHLLADKDALVPSAAGMAIANINPAHKLVLIPQSAHALHWSQPEKVAEEIEQFVRKIFQSNSMLDKKKVAQSFGRAAPTYDSVAQLQRDVGKHLLQYLPLDMKANACVVDLGSGTGFFTRQLAGRFNPACILGVDISEGMLQFSQAQSHGHTVNWLCGDAEHLPLASNSVDLLYSSLAIQWCSDLPQLLRELARVLKPGASMHIATLGPNTLHELKSAWQQVDNYVHVNHFYPQDELRLAAVAADLAIEHFAVEQRVIFFERLTELTRELKALGAHNINAGKPEGLTGRSRIAAFKSAYEQFRDKRGLPATYEVFYLSVRKKNIKN